MSLPALVYLLTLWVAVVVAITRVRLSRASSVTRSQIGPFVQYGHTVCGVAGTVLWLLYLVLGPDLPAYLLVGIVGIGLIHLTAFAGIMLLLRWVPSKGRHADEDAPRSRLAPALSLLGHLGVVAAAGVFTWAYLIAAV